MWPPNISLLFSCIVRFLFQIRGGRSRYDTYDSDDAASENSSVCSERSFASLGKTSEVSSTNFAQQ